MDHSTLKQIEEAKKEFNEVVSNMFDELPIPLETGLKECIGILTYTRNVIDNQINKLRELNDNK